MGVLGLTPFIQKTCPEAIRTLHNRLRDLSGRTVVIDGTLITQRLHFAPMPHRHRHVLGWYRIMKELIDCNVRAICVFDGKERSLAKELEMERRRHIRRMTAARGALELERLERLRKLAGLLRMLRTLGSPAQEQVAAILQELTSQPNAQPPPVPSWLPAVEPWRTVNEPELPKHIIRNFITPYETFGQLDNSDISELLKLEPTAALVSQHVSSADTDANVVDDTGLEDDVDETDIEEDHDVDETDIEEDHENVHDALPVEPDREGPSEDVSEDPGVTLTDDDAGMREISAQLSESLSLGTEAPRETNIPDETQDAADEGHQEAAPKAFRFEANYSMPLPDPKEIPSALASLYYQYRQSLPKLAALPATAPATSAVETVSEQEKAALKEEAQTEHAMSKRQHELTMEEGVFWDHLSDAQPSQLGADTVEHELAGLAERSNIISQSYERRTHPPTAETYVESKEILRAMGVPCIESTGPFEAEALASSLVLHGYADYVASEDTDVLVYEAPLIRNIANRSGPLLVISGTDVRATLQLDRAGFIDFALLLGTDFSQRIKNVGPARALRFIRAHGSIERMLECEPRYPPRVDLTTYLSQVSLARAVFQTLPPTPDADLLQPREYDEEEVMRVLGNYGLHREAMQEFDHTSALSGNFFSDDPSAT
ncbi:PIN domain-like protein [Rhodofomes roseus]|uniref:PIN domain-like protein n=1 Tax=Rhodofomes roseus TaxID=34475 RepID=A0A4Y9YS15_9APHY|nr:PIN domain-like protein [Rhodofomes roseus]KAH9836345.1 PIN domain-like protein [Rhodofomes roseus]TFY64570.1 hypothetical protein EVJ58_g2545 [Rhodofomes roseus]